MATSPSIEKLIALLEQYRTVYSGQWITAGWACLGVALYGEAAHAFEKARDGFGKKSAEWQDLEAWRAFAEAKIPPIKPRRPARPRAEKPIA